MHLLVNKLPLESESEEESVIDTCEAQFQECMSHFEKHQLDKASKISKDLLAHYEANSICADRLKPLRKI